MNSLLASIKPNVSQVFLSKFPTEDQLALHGEANAQVIFLDRSKANPYRPVDEVVGRRETGLCRVVCSLRPGGSMLDGAPTLK